MEKNRKLLLFLVVILIIFYLVVSIILSIPKEKKYSGTVFIGDSTKVDINGETIKVYDEDKKIAKQKVKIYFDGKIIDGYITSTDSESSGVANGYILHNVDGERLILGSVLLAYTDDISIKIKDTERNESTSLDEVYKFAEAKDISISPNSKLGYIYVSTVDLNDDGKEDTIYSVGLIEETKYDSFVFVKLEDKYILVDREESNYDEASNISLNFYKMIDFDNDDNYEFVVERTLSEYGPYHYELYKFDGSSFSMIGGE